jgi:hypothetical protein
MIRMMKTTLKHNKRETTKVPDPRRYARKNIIGLRDTNKKVAIPDCTADCLLLKLSKSRR